VQKSYFQRSRNVEINTVAKPRETLFNRTPQSEIYPLTQRHYSDSRGQPRKVNVLPLFLAGVCVGHNHAPVVVVERRKPHKNGEDEKDDEQDAQGTPLGQVRDVPEKMTMS
jgi:hypothetical protein